MGMRLVACTAVMFLATARAEANPNQGPGWEEIPAMLSGAIDDDALRACAKKLPITVSMVATRDPKTGATKVSMPVYGVGGRGFTPQEKCLVKVVAKIALPDLPPGVDRVVFGHDVLGANVIPPSPDDAFNPWRNLPPALASIVDDTAKTALAACDTKARTIRVILDLRKGATRVWLPAWQFHSAKRDGTTPNAEKKVKGCIEKVIATWQPPPLPQAMAELQLAIAVSP
jgi:hypothetical protein